ncbi:serine hydrolase domain-containing protein [Roseateles cellulosilyticus]|uniref:Beta-lactamase family protein n=1 Tax=Pelomonas cellulosilytica TaxID=2906762 RepID=A0ABS8XYP9_9BURK|nr:serine hydrolase domain-containing protein [Pelomonas sp. P8]MCE4556428.1 beta-lactamase family protein [Pelomonas sp. P8]
MRRLLIATLLAAALGASADTTSSGHSYSPPEAFAASVAGNLLTFTAPEGDATVTVVDLPAAKDAADAVAQAWARVQPDFRRTLRLATPRPSRNGWVDQQVFDYETSPNEKLTIQAIARRASTGDGKAWVVLLLQAGEGTLEKRGAPIGKFFASLRPQGYQRESFAGRTARPLTPERVEQLKAFIADGMKQLDVPGVGLSFISGGQVVWAGGLGVRELGKPAKVDADTLFMAASNTKAMTTALLARAVDAGKLRWDQPAAEAYPGFRLADADVTKSVQIRHLVCACTGMPRQDMDWIFSDGRAPASTTFDQLATMKPTSKFGEVFQYSNLMVSAGGYIAAAALKPGKDIGAAYDEAMQELLFGPLGMKDTTFDRAKALRGNHAMPHGDDIDGHTRRASMDLNDTVIPARPAGGVWTSPRDFSRFVLMELNKGRTPEGRPLIGEANWAERYKPQVMVSEDVNYGMGLFIDTQYGITVASHGGDLLGFHSNMIWLPEYGIGATILTNSDAGVLLRGPLLRKLLEVVFDGLPEADERLKVAVANRKAEAAQTRGRLTLPVPADAIKPMAAAYASPELGHIKIARRAGKLRFQFDHWSSEVALRRNEDGTQSYITIDPGVEGIEFLRDDKAGAPTLVLRDAQHEYRFVALKPN